MKGKSIKEKQYFEIKPKLRDVLISSNFGLCERGPIIFDMLSVIYGKKFAKKMWSKEWKQK